MDLRGASRGREAAFWIDRQMPLELLNSQCEKLVGEQIVYGCYPENAFVEMQYHTGKLIDAQHVQVSPALTARGCCENPVDCIYGIPEEGWLYVFVIAAVDWTTSKAEEAIGWRDAAIAREPKERRDAFGRVIQASSARDGRRQAQTAPPARNIAAPQIQHRAPSPVRGRSPPPQQPQVTTVFRDVHRQPHQPRVNTVYRDVQLQPRVQRDDVPAYLEAQDEDGEGDEEDTPRTEWIAKTALEPMYWPDSITSQEDVRSLEAFLRMYFDAALANKGKQNFEAEDLLRAVVDIARAVPSLPPSAHSVLSGARRLMKRLYGHHLKATGHNSTYIQHFLTAAEAGEDPAWLRDARTNASAAVKSVVLKPERARENFRDKPKGGAKEKKDKDKP